MIRLATKLELPIASSRRTTNPGPSRFGSGATADDRVFVRTLARCFALGLPADAIADELARVASCVASWEAVGWLLNRHQCSTMAYQVLRTEGVRFACGVPESTFVRLRERYASYFPRVVSEPPILHRIVDTLHRSGIPALAVKGPVIGSWLYGDPVLREHEDLDLIVPEPMAGECDEVLTELGYRTPNLPFSLPRLSPHELLNSTTYVSADGQPPVDVSYDPLRLFWRPKIDAALSFDGLWERRRTVVLGGRPIATLGLEDELIYLTRHLHFHDFFRVNWFVDVLLLLRQHGDELDWDFIGRAARTHALHGGLYRTLELLESAYGFRPPEEASSALRPNLLVRRLHRRIWSDAVAVPRDNYSTGGSPLVPRYVSLRGTHPAAAALLLAMRPDRRRNYGYLWRRIVPSRAWLQTEYAGRGQPSGSYPILLVRHLKRLRQIRRQVMADLEAKRR